MSATPLNRLQIAWRAAQDITDGMLVNLGLGIPVSVADYLRPEVDVFIQSENGVIGVGALAPDIGKFVEETLEEAFACFT